MSQQPQNYQNHTRFNKFTIALVLITFVVLVLQVVNHFTEGNSLGVFALTVLNVVVLLAFFDSRTNCIRLQDRLIQLEMRTRLKEILPEDLKGQISNLTKGQLISLRFASDGEMEGLVRKVLSGELKKGSEIKKEVKDWQADHQRV